MANRIMTFLNKEFRGLNEAALLLGTFTFLSQILGLIRDRLLASSIGPGPLLDTYYAAFRIPDFLYISVASLASITVLMPFLVEKINDNNGENKAQKFMNNIFTVYMIFMVGISLVVAILMPYIAPKIAPGFDQTQLKNLVMVSRIMLFSPIFIGLSNLIGTVTQLFRNFLVFSLSPILYNIGILFGIIFLYPKIGIYGLAIGVVIGALMHLGIQIPVVAQKKYFPKFITSIYWKEIFQVIKTSLPRTIALSCNSLAFIFLIAIASKLTEGSISLFTFSYNLQSVPVGIIGISYSVAAFPILVKSFSTKNMGNFINQIIGAARQIIFWSLPVLMLFVVLRAQIVRVILGSGTFSWADTRLTAAAVALFVISLVSQGLVLLLVRGYYAAGNTKKPLIVNVFSSLIIIVFAYLLIFVFKQYPEILNKIEILLRVKDVPGTLMLALPIAYTLGSLLNFFLIWYIFQKDFLKDGVSRLFRTFIETAIGALVMGEVAYLLLNVFDNIFDINTGIGIFLQGLFSGLIGILAGLFILLVFKNQELLDLIQAVKNKFWKNRIIAPEQTDI
jgi:putative peptidoglycan lipid II flippase